MIVVLPDSKTIHNGSMYSSSVTTGDFEKFIACDVVAYVDAHYRTLPNRLSRSLVGHPMWGQGRCHWHPCRVDTRQRGSQSPISLAVPEPSLPRQKWRYPYLS